MDKLEMKSALYIDYEAGIYGVACEHPLTLCERKGQTMLNLVVWDDEAINKLLEKTIKLSLPGPGEPIVKDNSTILWTGPDRYLIVSIDPSIQKSIASELSDEHGALQNLTAARTIIRMEGLACCKVMAKGLSVELGDVSFRAGQVILSSFDRHYPAIIHNVSDRQTKYDIYITRSFALSFWQWLRDSSLEFGYEVIESE